MLHAEVRKHLWDVLGLEVVIQPWEGAGQLPFHLQDSCDFAALDILGVPCVLIQAREGLGAAGQVRKRLELLERLTSALLVHVMPTLSAYERKRLIELKIPFIVPGNQLYLPNIGLDLREHFRQRQERPLVLSPASQALLLRVLQHPWQAEVHPAALMGPLGYTAMTLSRAGRELEAAGLVQVVSRGRARWLRLQADGPRALWQVARPLLRDPVRKCVWVAADFPGLQALPLAGESALARMTLLADPENPVRAVDGNCWQRMQQEGISLLPAQEPGAQQLQLWRYSPDAVESGSCVDRLSLILSLQGERDERVRLAVDELEEQLLW